MKCVPTFQTLVVFTREGLVHEYISPMLQGNLLESQILKGSLFKPENVYFMSSKHSLRNWPLVKSHKRTFRYICPQENKASIVSKEFYGLPAEFHGPQRFIELGIKNNSFNCLMA